VSHTSARIGEAVETLEHGLISHINATAAGYGLRLGMTVKDAAARLEAAQGARTRTSLAGEASS
jgi:hypothetical protein